MVNGKFLFRGLKQLYTQAAYPDVLYFATDTFEIILNGRAYGLSAELEALVKTSYQSMVAGKDAEGKHILTITKANGTTVTVDIESLYTDAKDYADGLNTAMDTRVKALEDSVGTGGSVDQKIANAIGGLDVEAIGGTGKVITTVSETDGKISATAIDLNAGNVAATATEATDEKVAVEGTTVAAQIGSLAKSVKSVSAAAKSYSVVTETEDLPSNVAKRYRLQETIGSVSNVVGTPIDVLKDSSVTDHYLGTAEDTVDAATGVVNKVVTTDPQSLNIVTHLADGTYTITKIDLKKFLTESEFGNGLVVAEGKVSVKVDAASEGFLTVGVDGVKLSGVQDAINQAKSDLLGDAAEGYNTLGKLEDKIIELDGKAASAHTVVNAKADGHVKVAVAKSEDGSHDVVTITEEDIASKQGLADEIARATAAEGANATAIANEIDRAKAAEKANADAITILNGDEATTGSVAKSVKDAVDAAKSTIDNYTVNGKKISTNPVLAGSDVKVGTYTSETAGVGITSESTIAEALKMLEDAFKWVDVVA